MRWLILPALAGLVGIALALWGFVVEPQLLFERQVMVETERWPAERPPLRIAIVSDLHVGGPHIDLEVVEDIVGRVNRMAADIVVMLGDFVVTGRLYQPPVPPEPIARLLADLRTDRQVIAVLGNHDWWYDGARVRQALEGAGMIVLENRAQLVELAGGPLWIVGIGDDMTGHADPATALAAVSTAAPAVVLAHDPAVFPQVAGRAAVTLSGHTHGGQVWLPWIGPLIIPGRSPKRYAYGHVRESGGDLFVTAGVGTSILPVRFNMPPEIVLLTLRSARSRSAE